MSCLGQPGVKLKVAVYPPAESGVERNTLESIGKEGIIHSSVRENRRKGATLQSPGGRNSASGVGGLALWVVFWLFVGLP
jgi:hypothetical protein